MLPIEHVSGQTMRAAVFERYGPPKEVLKLAELPVPTLGPDQLLVRVRATSVNPADCKQRSGNLKRIVKHSFPCVIGQDFAGVVERIGERCSSFTPGDEVYGCTAPRNGCSAELIAVFEREVTHKPPSLSWSAAAATPTVSCTAYRGIVQLGRIGTGHRVLIHGASGGVGSAAAQLAVARGAVVSGTCGAHNVDYVRQMGVTPINYSSAPFDSGLESGSFDLVFDAVGGDEYYTRSRRLLKRGGRYISAVGPVLHGGSEPVTLGAMLRTARILLPRLLFNAFAATRYVLFLSFRPSDLASPDLAQLISSGQLRLRRDPQEFDLATLGDAHAKCETNHSQGKLVVWVSKTEAL